MPPWLVSSVALRVLESSSSLFVRALEWFWAPLPLLVAVLLFKRTCLMYNRNIIGTEHTSLFGSCILVIGGGRSCVTASMLPPAMVVQFMQEVPSTTEKVDSVSKSSSLPM